MFKKEVFAFFLCMVSFVCFAQSINKDVAQTLEKHFSVIRSKKFQLFELKNIQAKNEEQFLAALQTYTKDSLAEVRYQAYVIAKGIGQRSTNTLIRVKAADILVGGLLDKITQNTKLCSKSLSQFRKNDFSADAKKQLSAALGNEKADVDMLIRLHAFVGTGEQLIAQRKQIFGGDAKVRWNCAIALARLGNSDAAKEVQTLFAAQAVTDDMLEYMGADVVFTHNKACIALLVAILNDDATNCISPNPDSDRAIPCGYRAMELLAAAGIKNFPLKLHPSGDVDAKNYKQALQTVREWFKKQGDNYEFDSEMF